MGRLRIKNPHVTALCCHLWRGILLVMPEISLESGLEIENFTLVEFTPFLSGLNKIKHRRFDGWPQRKLVGCDSVQFGLLVPTYYRNSCDHLKRGQSFPAKRRYIATKLHDVTCMKTVVKHYQYTSVVIFPLVFHFHVESNPFITTSIYATLRL
jgi:hypothetical protein